MDRYDGNNFCWVSISSRVWQSGYEGFLGQTHSAAELGMAVGRAFWFFKGFFPALRPLEAAEGATLVRVAEEAQAGLAAPSAQAYGARPYRQQP